MCRKYFITCREIDLNYNETENIFVLRFIFEISPEASRV